MQGPFEDHIFWPYYGHILGTSGIIDFLSGKVDVWAQLQTSGLVYFNVVQCMNMVMSDNKTRGIRGWVL